MNRIVRVDAGHYVAAAAVSELQEIIRRAAVQENRIVAVAAGNRIVFGNGSVDENAVIAFAAGNRNVRVFAVNGVIAFAAVNRDVAIGTFHGVILVDTAGNFIVALARVYDCAARIVGDGVNVLRTGNRSVRRCDCDFFAEFASDIIHRVDIERLALAADERHTATARTATAANHRNDNVIAAGERRELTGCY